MNILLHWADEYKEIYFIEGCAGQDYTMENIHLTPASPFPLYNLTFQHWRLVGHHHGPFATILMKTRAWDSAIKSQLYRTDIMRVGPDCVTTFHKLDRASCHDFLLPKGPCSILVCVTLSLCVWGRQWQQFWLHQILMTSLMATWAVKFVFWMHRWIMLHL